MPEFAWERLRRAPDVEAPNLFAFDATDRLLTEWALSTGIPGPEIVVVGDEYGAITLRLAHAGRAGIRVYQDLATGRRALARNATALGLGGFAAAPWGAEMLAGARLVLVQLPKSLAELDEIADAVARWAAPDVVLVAGGRVKHMTLAQNEVLARSFSQVQPQRAAQKSRLIVAAEARAVPAEPQFPVWADAAGLRVAAHGGVFAGAKLDIGTRALWEMLPEVAADEEFTAVDLGCGTGILAATFSVHHPTARVIATDRSAAAVRSAQATMAANGLADRVTVTHDDAGSELPAESADLVLLNPPFHLGTSVHKSAATRLFDASARLLKPGGQLWAVWNSSLAYRPQLERLIGPTEQRARNSKFTVTRSVRRVSNR